MPIAAPTSSCLLRSLEASGNSLAFLISEDNCGDVEVGGVKGRTSEDIPCSITRPRLKPTSSRIVEITSGITPVLEMRATISPAVLTTGSFPFLDRRNTSFASVKETPSCANRKSRSSIEDDKNIVVRT